MAKLGLQDLLLILCAVETSDIGQRVCLPLYQMSFGLCFVWIGSVVAENGVKMCRKNVLFGGLWCRLGPVFDT